MTPAKLQELASEAMDVTTDARGRVTFECDSYGLAKFAALVRAAALTEAAEVCEAVRDEGDTFAPSENTHDDGHMDGCNNCCAAIYALAQQAGGEEA